MPTTRFRATIRASCTPEQKRAAERFCAERVMSLAELVRAAIAAYITTPEKEHR